MTKSPTLRRRPSTNAPDDRARNNLRVGDQLLLVDGRRYRVLTTAGRVLDQVRFDRATLTFRVEAGSSAHTLAIDDVLCVAPVTLNRCGYAERAQREPFVDLDRCYLDGAWRTHATAPGAPWVHPYRDGSRRRAPARLESTWDHAGYLPLSWAVASALGHPRLPARHSARAMQRCAQDAAA